MQQVNLLKNLERPTVIFPASMASMAIAGIILLMLIISLGQWGHWTYRYYKLSSAKREVKQTVEQYHQLAQKHPILARTASLDAAITSLTKQLTQSRKRYGALSQYTLQSGFYRYLYTFADTLKEKVSLDAFYISRSTNNIVLYGTSSHPDDVSQMVADLYKTPLFKKIHFEKIMMEHQVNGLMFEVATKDLISNEQAKQLMHKNNSLATLLLNRKSRIEKAK